MGQFQPIGKGLGKMIETRMSEVLDKFKQAKVCRGCKEELESIEEY